MYLTSRTNQKMTEENLVDKNEDITKIIKHPGPGEPLNSVSMENMKVSKSSKKEIKTKRYTASDVLSPVKWSLYTMPY